MSSSGTGGTEPVIDLRHHHTTARLVVSGDVDLASGERLRCAVVQVLDGQPGELVIDLTGVEFMDSAGLNHLVRALRDARGVPLRLLVRHAPVVSLFEMTGLSGAFTVHRVA